MRFTVDGSEALEGRIHADMVRIREAALVAVGAENMTALVLGGGYGRGEGGVYVVDGEERVYNDYDFFVVVPFTSRRRRKWVAARLEEVKMQVEPDCGIHVDFSPPMPLSSLPHQPYELMYMEAKAGYHVIYGPEDVFDALPDYDVSNPPLEECARLFMNRGVGLLLAAQMLGETTSLDLEGEEFVVRNVHKAYMAMGDSVLFIAGQYCPSYVARRRVFDDCLPDTVPDPATLAVAYGRSLDFKMRPSHAVPDGLSLVEWHQLSADHFLQMLLWFERIRLGRPDLDLDAYAALPARLPKSSGMNALKDLYRNIRHSPGLIPPKGEWYLHPRDRILKRLPGLLCHGDSRELDVVLPLWSAVG